YTIEANDRTPFLRVSEGESFLLPPSQWFPVIHTPFGDHGADTAPFTLTVVPPPGQKVISAGIRKSENSFEQSLAALPFFIVGDFEVLSRGGEPAAIEIYLQRGLNEAGRQQAQRLADEAEKSLAFCTKYFGVPAGAPWRAISTSGFGSTSVTSDGVSQSRESTYATTGALFLDDSFFRRDVLDLGTVELVASSASRAWIDGRLLLRGRGNGMLRDALPIYLVARYLGERNGPAAADAAFERYRRAYAPLARGSDAPLLMISPLDRNYTSSMFSKGALVWRLIEKQTGQAAFDGIVRQMLDRQRSDVLSLVEWKSPLCGRSRCTNMKAMLVASPAGGTTINDTFAQWIETVVVPDFAVGQPQKTASGMESTIVNFGNGDFTVDLVATTDKGEKLKQTITVKGGEYGSIPLPSDKPIVSIEADPEKIYPQKDYSNDSYPRQASPGDLYGEANLAFSNGDLKTAESKGREALAASPDSPALMAFLGRVLLAAKKNDEASQVFNSALKDNLITIQAYAWAHLGLGALAAEQKKPAEAARHFRLASTADVDVATTITARNGVIAAELESGTLKIPEDVRAILKQMDAAILQSSADAVGAFVDVGNLRRFAQSLVIRKPAFWTTEPTRAEQLDANRVAVDVLLKIKIDGKDYAGRALYILRKSGGKLLLSDVPVFDVK
ncbi:MAG: tetratricopeptide repeat protein, partial [Acidobacteriota bacterium]